MSEERQGPRPKWLDPNYDKYKKSKKHETRLANRLGGKRLPRSGGLAWSKWDKTTDGGDLTNDDFLFEHKMTEAKSISLKRDWLEKVTEGARSKLKDPAMILTFEGNIRAPKDWVLIPLEIFETLTAGENDE